MKTVRIITIMCWAAAALILLSLAVWFFIGPLFGFSANWGAFGGISIGGFESLTGNYEPAGTYNVTADGINSLKINWVSSGVRIMPYDGDDIQITEYAQRELKSGEELTIVNSPNTVTVNFCKEGKMRHMPRKQLEVFVPRGLSGNLKSLDAKSSSGDIFIENISADNFKVSTVSGNSTISGVAAETFRAESTSGEIEAALINAGEISLDSVSGDISVSESSARILTSNSTSGSHNLSGEFINTEHDAVSGRITLNNTAQNAVLETNTTSGDQNLSGSFDRASLNSISGKIFLNSTVIPASLTTDTTSGDVSVIIPEGTEIIVHHSATSGKFSSDLPVILQKKDARFLFSSTSGDVKIFAQ